MKVNKKSLYQEGGALDKSTSSISMQDLVREIQQRSEAGESAEQILFSYLQEGIAQEQLGSAFESLGYDPAAFTELIQSTQMMVQNEQQAQQQPMENAQDPILNPEAEAQFIAQLQAVQAEAQPEMQYGGNTTSRGPIASLPNQTPRPLYLPPTPAQGNVIGAAMMLDDFIGQVGSKKDRDGDGLMDGSFRDWKAKNARYKQKQLGNRSYEIDYGSNNPNDYSFTTEDLAKGKLRTNEEMASDIAKYSRLNFDPESNQYTGGLASSENEAKTFGKNQYKNTIALQDFLNNVSDYSKEDKEMLLEGMQYDKGRGMFMNEEGRFGSYSPETQANLTEKQRRAQQDSFRNIMLGNQRLTPNVTPTPQIEEPKTPVNSNQRSIVTIPNSDKPMVANIPDFKEWYVENSKSLMGKSQAEAKEIYDNTEFKYGGDLPKAQIMGEFDPNNPFGLPDFSQMGQASYINPATGMPWTPGPQALQNQLKDINQIDQIQNQQGITGGPGSGMGGVYADQLDFENLMNNMQTDYASNTQAVVDSQLQKGNPGLGSTPLQNQQAITGSGPGSGMGSLFLDQQALQKELEGINQIGKTANVPVTNTPAGPTVTRKRSIGNAINQVKDFVRYNPAMQAFGDVSEGAVLGANFVNEIFQEKKFNDYKNQLRNATTADKVYTAVENPVNKRGTFDANLGLAEPDNLVDYYAQAMYGKEVYRKGGEFEPHMMFDPKTGKGYEAKVPTDHERMAKMGFLHKDEMEMGGEVEVDNETLAALIAAGADIEML